MHRWCAVVTALVLCAPASVSLQTPPPAGARPNVVLIMSDDMGYGAQHAARPPFFVVTHEPPANVRLKLDLRFVADVPTAIEQAKAVAGDKDVFVMGGADVIRQALRAGHVEELAISIAPVVLGGGKRLFDGLDEPFALEHVGLLQSPFATHITYRVVDLS